MLYSVIIRLSFISLLLVGQSSFAQTDSIKYQTPINLNVSSKPAISIRDPANMDISKLAPVLVINGKRFDEPPINQMFLNVNNINTINVINPAADSIQSFGPKAKNGVIILTTKNPIEWLTSKQIIQQNVKGTPTKKILFIVGNMQFNGNTNLYFEKNYIRNIQVRDSTAGKVGNKNLKVVKVVLKENGI